LSSYLAVCSVYFVDTDWPEFPATALVSSAVKRHFALEEREGVRDYMRKLALTAAVSLTLAIFGPSTPALADGAIIGLMSEEDTRVLEAFDARREAAIATAMDGSNEGSTAVLRQVLAGEVLSFDDGYDPSGDWRCRYIKLGGEPALTVYGWFSCRIFDDGAGWVVQKADGSQRSMGRLYNIPREQLLYLGALYYAYEDPIWFGDDAARNQLALLSRLDDGRMRLEFPAPLVESDFDILELAP
jgi:hypothetical protein